jgi:hypothetical protein
VVMAASDRKRGRGWWAPGRWAEALAASTARRAPSGPWRLAVKGQPKAGRVATRSALDQRKRPNARVDLVYACLDGPGAPGGGGVLCLHPGCAASARGGSPARVEEQKISRAALAEMTESARRAVDPARPEDVLRPWLVRGGRIKLPGPIRSQCRRRRRDPRSWPRGLEQPAQSPGANRRDAGALVAKR